MGPLAEIRRPWRVHTTALFLDGHRRPRLYRTCILSQSISLFKYPSELSAKPHWGEASGHFDPQIVRTNPFIEALAAGILDSPAPPPTGLPMQQPLSKLPDVAIHDLDDDHAQAGRSGIGLYW